MIWYVAGERFGTENRPSASVTTTRCALVPALVTVTVAPGSRLAKVLGTDDVEVNSFHHQVIKALGRGLKPVAWAPDQLVEGVELDDDARFVVGVQWHPEHLVGGSESARRLFASLIAAART